MRKTAFVTGGGQGIGRGIVGDLVARGWAVACVDRDADALAELASANSPENLLTLKADVGSEAQVKHAFTAFDAWLKKIGDARGLDLLVNNAGIADPHSGPIEKLKLADWNRWLDSHLTGAFLCTKYAVPRLRRSAGSSIVNMASTRALQSEPDCEAYAASKGGIVAFTHALAISLGPAIRCNAICPGWIETASYKKRAQRKMPKHRKVDNEQHPVGRVGVPDDIVDAVLYLAASSFVTGQRLVVDGGMTRKMIYAE
jgi:NAD(P)-dependent dehydrogenase (short-subunit alcohol dehydrogenase family)